MDLLMELRNLVNPESRNSLKRTFELSHIAPGAMVALIVLLLSGIGAWYSLSAQVALQGQRIDTLVPPLSQRMDHLADELARHESLMGHPVEMERNTENIRRIDQLESRVRELEVARDRYRRAALIERMQILQNRVRTLQAEHQEVKEEVEHQPIVWRIARLFGG